MDLTSGAPYWPLKNGLLGIYPPLARDEKCDVAIIGGGVTGALCAYLLTAAGFDVVLLDKRDIGFGSTCASTSLLLYELDTDLVDLIPKIGQENAERSYQLCRAAIDKIENIVAELDDDCGFARSKSLYLASRRRDAGRLQREYSARSAAGFRVEYWEQKTLKRISSLPHPAAILSHDAAQMDAFRFTHKLMEKAAARGLRVYDRTEVTQTEYSARGARLETSRGKTVRARKVIIATGYEAEEKLFSHIVALHSTYAIVTEPLPNFAGWPERGNAWMMWETARPYLYLRATSDGRAIIGGEDIVFKNELARDRLIAHKAAVLLQRFHQLFPDIKTEIAFAWAGTFGATKDGLAYIGAAPENPHALYALGFGGNGITFSAIAAEIIRDLCAGRENADAALFRFDR
jgi:glycine/D-amino acid oxidase-like deaminating enzyme